MELELKLNTTPLSLRKHLGVLGIALPFVLWSLTGFELQPSISHYYYTGMSVIFTGILFTFGLFLFSYKGYDKTPGEVISDNFATNIAGVLVILTAVIPTTCLNEGCEAPNWHTNELIGLVHAGCAGLFFIIMGWMSIFQFTKGEAIGETKKRRNRLYRLCGWIVWVVIAVLILKMLLEKDFTKYDVLVGETIALVFFGTAWLVKSKSLQRLGI